MDIEGASDPLERRKFVWNMLEVLSQLRLKLRRRGIDMNRG
jgi:hypothetical protein